MDFHCAMSKLDLRNAGVVHVSNNMRTREILHFSQHSDI